MKRLLSNSANAKEIFDLYLPKNVRKLIDLNHLELQRDSFIDDEHRAFSVDLLFKTTFQKEKGYIWVLLEHQSTDDPWLPVRIFKYIGTIWEHLRKNSRQGKIPFIYPLVIYSGKRPYAHSLTLQDMIEPKASQTLLEGLFTRPIHMLDPASIKDEALRGHLQEQTRGIALLMTLKHAYDKNIQPFFEHDLVKAYKLLDQSGSRDDVADMLYYLLNEGEFLSKERFWDILHEEFSPELEGKVMTIAQKLKAEARKQGASEALQAVAIRLLSEGADLKYIARLTKLSLAKLRELQSRPKH